MLNKGPHAAAAVTFLRDILSRMDRHQTKKSPRLGPLRVWRGQEA
jgi:pyruvate kinase